MTVHQPQPEPEITLHDLAVHVCQLCLDGKGGECHVPGCSFWMRTAPTGDTLEWLHDQRDLAALLTTDPAEETSR